MTKNFYLKFDIAVRDYYGSNNIAIAFSRLIYWFGKKPDGFYKFKEPCKHPLYNKGDSWSEDLRMTKRVLDPVLKMLVTHHKSKNDYRNAEDKFNGKMFCSYTERNTNRTFYFMDKEAVDKFLSTLAPGLSISPSPALPSEVVLSADHPINMSSPKSREIQMVVPLRADASDSLNTQTITSLPGEEEKLSSKEMVKVWNSQMSDKVVWYPSIASRLYRVLADFFGGCLEAFKKYCLAISNTPFLTGKAPNSKFKAFFYWVIKPEVIKSIFQGAYGVKDILSKIGNESELEKLEKEYYSISSKIQNVKDKIEFSKRDIIIAQDKSIAEHQETISQQVKDSLLESVKLEIGKVYDLSTYSEKEKGWLINPKYRAALVDYSRVKLNLYKPEEIITPQEFLDEQKQLEDRRVAICKRLQEILRENEEDQKNIENLVEKAA